MECGEIFQRRWADIKRYSFIRCRRCSLKIKESYDDISEVVLTKGMSKDEINSIIGEWLKFEDECFIINNHNHNWRCLKCGNIFSRAWSNIKTGKRIQCEKCRLEAKDNYSKLSDVILFQNMLKNEVNMLIGELLLLEDDTYQGTNFDHRWECLDCGNTFVRTWSNIKRSNSTKCLYCTDNVAAMSKRGNLRLEDSIWYNNKYIAETIVSDKDGNKVDLKKISGKFGRKYYYKCNQCGSTTAKPIALSNVVEKGLSCRYCSDGVSIPEKFISGILQFLNIEFETQKSFEWSKNEESINRKLRGIKYYDFYIPHLNIIIESHGRQHYINTGRKGDRVRSLKDKRENDVIKFELAMSNGISPSKYTSETKRHLHLF